MGTRNLTLICKDEKYVLAQYGQFDGYPESAGVNILEQISSKLNRLEEKLPRIKNLSPEEVTNKWKECGATDASGYVTMEVADKMREKYPALERSLAYGVIEYIIESEEEEILTQSSLDFASDSLFCEWAYVIDFDSNKFEVYTGSNHQELKDGDRFYFLQNLEEIKKEYKESKKKWKSSECYYPIRLVCSFDLNGLPEKDEFLRLIEMSNNEYEEEIKKQAEKKKSRRKKKVVA